MKPRKRVRVRYRYGRVNREEGCGGYANATKQGKIKRLPIKEQTCREGGVGETRWSGPMDVK